MSPSALSRSGAARRRKPVFRWAGWSEQRLLDTRLCDLGLTLARSPLEQQIAVLYRELDRRGIRFRPHCWLSDCWFSPDGVPGFAIPFYLAHPRLAQLEKRWMLELEGGSRQECQKLMRHETAHALANAYRLHRRHEWRRRFGRAARSYPESYLPRPDSRSYVINLDGWYAQSHPHEDWAETFAVWLDPRSGWHERYRGWPALRKLEYVDALMQEIGQQRQALHNRRHVDSVSTLRLTLRQYFEQKQERLGAAYPRFHRQQLERIFPAARSRRTEPAARFIRRHRRDALVAVSLWTAAPRYRVNLTLTHMAQLADELDLHAPADGGCAQLPQVSALIMLYMGSLRAGSSRLTL
ncbi:MAG: putative zinc-binding metallopeptidase [Acidiferrobacterales bacterium]